MKHLELFQPRYNKSHSGEYFRPVIGQKSAIVLCDQCYLHMHLIR